MCTQWSSKGYFYPITVAQYALSHYSKSLIEKPSQQRVYEDAETRTLAVCVMNKNIGVFVMIKILHFFKVWDVVSD